MTNGPMGATARGFLSKTMPSNDLFKRGTAQISLPTLPKKIPTPPINLKAATGGHGGGGTSASHRSGGNNNPKSHAAKNNGGNKPSSSSSLSRAMPRISPSPSHSLVEYFVVVSCHPRRNKTSANNGNGTPNTKQRKTSPPPENEQGGKEKSLPKDKDEDGDKEPPAPLPPPPLTPPDTAPRTPPDVESPRRRSPRTSTTRQPSQDTTTSATPSSSSTSQRQNFRKQKSTSSRLRQSNIQFQRLISPSKTAINRVLRPNDPELNAPLARARRLNNDGLESITLPDEPKTVSKELRFAPVITARYPLEDWPENPLNKMVTKFCFPGSDVITLRRDYVMPKVHYFVLTNDRGTKVYGTCLTVYEPYETEHEWDLEGDDSFDSIEISLRKREYYLPKCLCLLSAWPYLTAFREYLTQLYRLVTTTDCMVAPLERYIVNLCEEVPAPPPGAFEIRVSVLQSTIRFWAPPANQPIAYVSLPFTHLFSCLDIENIIFLWNALALERKVLLVSSQQSLLTVCAETLVSLLFPMSWHHLYIPVLPSFLSPMLDAPMPYLCGISRSVFATARENLSEDAILVDLDKNKVTMGPTTPDLPPLPRSRRYKLEKALEQNAGHVFWRARCLDKTDVENVIRDGEGNVLTDRSQADEAWSENLRGFDDAISLAHAPGSVWTDTEEKKSSFSKKQSAWDAVQEAFLRFYVSLLKDYRKFINLEQSQFWKDAFVESQSPSYQPFLAELVETQQFDEFINRRVYDPGQADVTFFDQSIDAKSNRSKFKLRKTDTPFLQSAYAHKQLTTIDAVPVNTDNLPPTDEKIKYDEWPEALDPQKLVKARSLPKIVVAEFDRQSAIAAKLRRTEKSDKEDKVLGTNSMDLQTTAFSLYFIVYTATIGATLHDFAEESMVDRTSLGIKQAFVGKGEFMMRHRHRRQKDKKDLAKQTGFLNFDGSPGSPYESPRPSTTSISYDNTPLTTNKPHQAKMQPQTVPSDILGSSKHDQLLLPELTSSTQIKLRPTYSSTSDTSSILSSLNLNDLEDARSLALNQLDVAFDVLELMHSRSLIGDQDLYKKLIESCARCGDAERAEELMEICQKSGVVINGEMQVGLMKAFNVQNVAQGTLKDRRQGHKEQFRKLLVPMELKDMMKQLKKSTLSSAAAEQLRTFSNNAAVSSRSNNSNPLKALSVKSGGTSHAESAVGSPPGVSTASSLMSDIYDVASSFMDSSNHKASTHPHQKRKKVFKKKHVPEYMMPHLAVSECLLDLTYPDLTIETSIESCPQCCTKLTESDIYNGFRCCNSKEYTTTCPQCERCFVANFRVHSSREDFEGSQGLNTPLYCEFLSPWVLRKELQAIMKEEGGMDKLRNEEWRNGTGGVGSMIWWNLVVLCRRYDLPLGFLLQQRSSEGDGERGSGCEETSEV